jgi:hypothetical protein
MTRGYDCRLRGELTYDTEKAALTQFDLVAAGDRWGGTEHNNRQEDLPRSPMGIVLRLAGTALADRAPICGSTSRCQRISGRSDLAASRPAANS